MTDSNSAWACRRCNTEGPRLAWPPWPGSRGVSIQQSICQTCWDDWLGMQTKIINEYRLNVLDPGHSKALAEQMEVFLGLKAPESPA